MCPRGNLRTCPVCSGNLYRSRGEPYSCLWCGREWEVRGGQLQLMMTTVPEEYLYDRLNRPTIGVEHPDNHLRATWMPLLVRMAERITANLRGE